MITLWKEITQAEVLIGPCFLIFRINYTYVFVSESIMYVSLSVFLVILSLIAWTCPISTKRKLTKERTGRRSAS